MNDKCLAIHITMFGVIDELWVIGTDNWLLAAHRLFNLGPSVLRAPAEQTKVATVLGN